MQFTVAVPQKVSLNVALRKHYRAVNKLKQEWHWSVSEANLEAYTGSYPVDIQLHYFLHGTPIDSGNAGFMTKALLDALVADGFFPDDNPKYIRWEANRSDRAKEGEYEHVVVSITPCA